MLMACARLQIREPIEFHSLSAAAQEMWLQFELDMWTGAYLNQERGRSNAAESLAAEAAFIEDARRKATQ